METFGIGVSHTYRSQDGQHARSHTRTQLMCAYEHALCVQQIQQIQNVFVGFLHTHTVSCNRYTNAVYKDALKNVLKNW